MKPELKAKIEALVSEADVAINAGETSVMEVALIALRAHRGADGQDIKTSGMAGGAIGAMVGASLFAGVSGEKVDTASNRGDDHAPHIAE